MQKRLENFEKVEENIYRKPTRHRYDIVHILLWKRKFQATHFTNFGYIPVAYVFVNREPLDSSPGFVKTIGHFSEGESRVGNRIPACIYDISYAWWCFSGTFTVNNIFTLQFFFFFALGGSYFYPLTVGRVGLWTPPTEAPKS